VDHAGFCLAFGKNPLAERVDHNNQLTEKYA